jgi:hypothetical protein
MTKQNVEELLSKGHIVQIEPIGYSMYPMFVPGRDYAILQQADPASYKRGDVVLYRRTGGMLVLHRIWKNTKQGFYMVGDNQVEVEGPLDPSQMIGKLIAFIRKGREISTNRLTYRLAAGLWLRLRPIRRPIQLTAACCKRCLRIGKSSQ